MVDSLSDYSKPLTNSYLNISVFRDSEEYRCTGREFSSIIPQMSTFALCRLDLDSPMMIRNIIIEHK